MEHYHGLCVGGPRDGCVHVGECRYGPYFRVLNRERLAVPQTALDSPAYSMIEATLYVFETLRSPPTKDRESEIFGIWRPEEQSMADTLRMLITGYHPAVPLG